jgi:hypothetical protein
LASAARASTPQHAPAAARIVAAKMPSFVMAAPCLDVDDPDLENDGYKTHFNLDEKFRS